MAKAFSRVLIAAVDESKILGLRSGPDHRFIGVWPVVVKGRLLVRSWSDKPRGWYRAFLAEPRGAMQVGDREVAIRARRCTGERLLDSMDAAYRAKYPTPGSRKFVQGFARASRRAKSMELLPR